MLTITGSKTAKSRILGSIPLIDYATFFSILFSVFLVFFAKYILHVNTVFTHFLYIPIILTGCRRGKYSLLIAFFFSLLLLIPDYLIFRPALFEDALRSLMFFLVAYIAGHLGEKYRRYEAMLSESRQRLADIIDFLPDATFSIDLQGRVTTWNNAIEKMTGIPARDMLGKDNYEYALPFYGKREPILIDLVLHRSAEYEKRYSQLNGINDVLEAESSVLALPDSLVWCKTTPLYAADGSVVGAIESIRDITIRKKMEDESIKAGKLEALGILAGGLAHDFNNLLTVILGNASLLKRALSGEEKARTLLSEIENAACNSKHLTDQLLTFSKGGAPIKEAVSIAELLSDSAGFALSGTNVSCAFAIQENLWNVEVDKGQFSQVLYNLVINACQAMPHGGTIYISCKNVSVTRKDQFFVKPGKYIRISVRDEGMGIPSDHLSKVFDPYFSTRHGGHGLGLAASYSIVKRHGGHVHVKSLPGKGTTFHIYLPALLEDVSLTAETPDSLIYRKGRVLFLDDNESIRTMAGKMLNHLGFEVALTGSGPDAVELYKNRLIKNNPFDLVIMDLTAPGGQGGESTIKLLRELNPGIKAIVSSGYSTDPIMANYRDYGFCGVIPKPYTIEKFSRTLSDLLV